VSIFKRGEVYRYHFIFGGQHIQESTKQGNREVAIEMERAPRVRRCAWRRTEMRSELRRNKLDVPFRILCAALNATNGSPVYPCNVRFSAANDLCTPICRGKSDSPRKTRRRWLLSLSRDYSPLCVYLCLTAQQKTFRGDADAQWVHKPNWAMTCRTGRVLPRAISVC
jgi:hypothetical protein